MPNTRPQSGQSGCSQSSGTVSNLPLPEHSRVPFGAEAADERFFEVVSGQPDEKDEEDEIGADDLCAFGTGQIRSEGCSERGFGKLPS